MSKECQGDCPLLIPDYCIELVIWEGMPFEDARENMRRYSRYAWCKVCTYSYGRQKVSRGERCDAWDIGLKINSTKQEGDLIGGPK